MFKVGDELDCKFKENFGGGKKFKLTITEVDELNKHYRTSNSGSWGLDFSMECYEYIKVLNKAPIKIKIGDLV